MKKALYIICGSLSVVLGVIGIFVPGLPTTPFLLLSSWLFYRSSRRLHDALHRSVCFGPYLKRYEEQRGMRWRTKLYAVLCMWVMIGLSAFLIFPLLVGLSAVAEPFILLLLKEQWLFASTLLQIICFGMMWYPIHAINLNLLQVKGRSDLFLRLEIIKKILAVIILCITVPMGLIAMCVGQIFSSIICLIINTHYTGKLIHVGFLQQVQDLLPTLLLSLTMWGVVYFTISFLTGASLQLITGMCVGVIYYIVFAFLFRFPELKEFYSIIEKR